LWQWLAAVSLVVVLAVGLEVLWRIRGHEPSVTDREALWAYHRHRVAGAGNDTLVLLGASRVLLGFSAEAFAHRYPDRRLVQLAVLGRPPLATLRDLAADDGFRATVLCSVMPDSFLPAGFDAQQSYIDFYHERSTAQLRWESRARAELQSRLALLLPHLNLVSLLSAGYEKGTWPKVHFVTTAPDRTRRADHRKVNVAVLRAAREHAIARGYESQQVPPPERWLELAGRVRPWVEVIHARGGRVIFVRYPTTGRHRELDEGYYPRADYWDHLARATGANTLHFDDVPAMRNIDCPDTSHIDQQDQSRFTEALLEALEERGWLEPNRTP
jgi:hypothetical protein